MQLADECSGTTVIVDVRFVNEGKKILQRGGEIWRVFRHEADRAPATHKSETEMNTEAFEHLVSRKIFNYGTLEDLRRFTALALNE